MATSFTNNTHNAFALEGIPLLEQRADGFATLERGLATAEHEAFVKQLTSSSA